MACLVSAFSFWINIFLQSKPISCLTLYKNNCNLITIINWLALQLQLINWKQNNWLQRLQLIFYNPCWWCCQLVFFEGLKTLSTYFTFVLYIYAYIINYIIQIKKNINLSKCYALVPYYTVMCIFFYKEGKNRKNVSKFKS